MNNRRKGENGAHIYGVPPRSATRSSHRKSRRVISSRHIKKRAFICTFSSLSSYLLMTNFIVAVLTICVYFSFFFISYNSLISYNSSILHIIVHYNKLLLLLMYLCIFPFLSSDLYCTFWV